MTQPQALSRTVPARTATTPFSEPWLSRLRDRLGSENGTPVLMGSTMPSEAERRRISMLAAQFKSRLTPSPDNAKHLAVVLAKLFAAFPASSAEPEASTKLRMEAYFDALAKIPAWAVAEARDAVLRGEGGCDGRFAPPPPQLARLAREAMRQTAEDYHALARLEQAVVRAGPSDEDRERVAAGLAALRDELAGASARDAPERARDRFAEMCAEAGVDPDSVPDAPERLGSFNRIGRAG